MTMDLGQNNKVYSRHNGQSTAEFAVLLAIIAAALIAMQVYVKRGLQGRIRNLADQISTQQYEQGGTNSTYVTKQDSSSQQVLENGTTTMKLNENTVRSGNETTTPQENL